MGRPGIKEIAPREATMKPAPAETYLPRGTKGGAKGGEKRCH